MTVAPRVAWITLTGRRILLHHLLHLFIFHRRRRNKKGMQKTTTTTTTTLVWLPLSNTIQVSSLLAFLHSTSPLGWLDQQLYTHQPTATQSTFFFSFYISSRPCRVSKWPASRALDLYSNDIHQAAFFLNNFVCVLFFFFFLFAPAARCPEMLCWPQFDPLFWGARTLPTWRIVCVSLKKNNNNNYSAWLRINSTSEAAAAVEKKSIRFRHVNLLFWFFFCLARRLATWSRSHLAHQQPGLIQ